MVVLIGPFLFKKDKMSFKVAVTEKSGEGREIVLSAARLNNVFHFVELALFVRLFQLEGDSASKLYQKNRLRSERNQHF